MRIPLLAALLLAALFSLTWAADPQPAKPAPQTPLVFYFQEPAREHAGGLICAVWEDGVVLSAMNWLKPGENLELSTLTGKPADLIAQLKSDGLLTMESASFTVPDAGYLTMGGCIDGKQAFFNWDEYIHPGYGRNNNPDEKYRTLVAGWFKTKVTLAALRTTGRRAFTDKDAPDGRFRGYRLDGPGLTSWLRDTEKKKK